MEKYHILERAGSGNFSQVFKAINIKTDEMVAIKDIRNSDGLEDLLQRQLKILQTMDHPNLIKLKEIIRGIRDTKVIFEYIDENLLQLYTTSKRGINEHQLRCILYQTAFGLQFLHRHRLIHRDIKPENILIDRTTALVKIIDFGLAKEEYLAETDYVATRWYRSPENLIGLGKYTIAIDIFALGCVAAQLFTSNPLFPGTNAIDQLNKIFALLGTPTLEQWPKAYNELRRKAYSFGVHPRRGLSSVIHNASPQFIDLLDKMLQLCPQKRITAREMLFHPFFNNVQRVIPQHVFRQVERLKEAVDSRSRSRNKSFLLHKNIEGSPSITIKKANLTDTHSQQFSIVRLTGTDRLMSDNISITQSIQQKSRERPTVLQTSINQDVTDKRTNRFDHLQSIQVPKTQKRFNYLSTDSYSPVQPSTNKFVALQQGNKYVKKSPTAGSQNTLHVPTQRIGILERSTRNSHGLRSTVKMNGSPSSNNVTTTNTNSTTGFPSRNYRNHSVMNEAMQLSISTQKINDLHNRSLQKIPGQILTPTYSGQPPIRIKVGY